MSSLVTSACILITIHFLLPYLFFLPKCVLVRQSPLSSFSYQSETQADFRLVIALTSQSAIVLLVVFGILQEAPHDLRFYISVGAWRDLLQMLGTFILTLMVDVEVSPSPSLLFLPRNSASSRRSRDRWVRGIC
jgi:hypothetical protein